MSSEMWTKTTMLDGDTEHTTEVEVPDTKRVNLTRDEMVRFLTEAGYEPKRGNDDG